MVWIILIAVVVVGAGLVALAWWSSGRARGIRHQPARDLTEAERNAPHQATRAGAYQAGASASAP